MADCPGHIYGRRCVQGSPHTGPCRCDMGTYEEVRRILEPEEQCGQCGAVILGCHACEGVPGGFSDD